MTVESIASGRKLIGMHVEENKFVEEDVQKANTNQVNSIVYSFTVVIVTASRIISNIDAVSGV
jgi:uncharacterized BrkB/YihY/UPF0761 family membrane protein